MPQHVTIMGTNTFRIFTLVNSAAVVMTNITISNGGGGGVTGSGLGGAIYMGDSGTLTLNDCTIANSTASAFGGGIYMSLSATLHVNRSSFSGNTASSWGGAIYVDTSGTVNLNTSTLSGNSATSGEGGAISNWGTLNAVNNTLSGNSAPSNAGGAVSNYGTMTFTNNTIVQNTADFVGGIVNWATATIDNNIIALNVGTGSVPDLWGAYAGSYNLIGNIDDSSGVSGAPNIVGTGASPLDPMIGPLQDNGGPTFTRALLTGSPALNNGNSPAYSTDQRGYPRQTISLNFGGLPGDGSDMGAFEGLAPSSSNVSIGGRFLTSFQKGGQGISGVTVYLADTEGNVQMARTNAFGYFQFPEVAAGLTYVASASHRQYQFESKAVSVTDEITDMNWTPLNQSWAPLGSIRGDDSKKMFR